MTQHHCNTTTPPQPELFMSLFSAFQSLWSRYSNPTADFTSCGPVVNVDGTPMLNDSVDVHGQPYGMVDALPDLHTGQDSWTDGSHDFGCGSDYGDGCGMGSSDW
jgi:hypothetical protein